AGAAHRLEAAEQEHHGALVLAEHLERHEKQDGDDDDYADAETDHRSTSTVRTSPCIPVTRSFCPRRTAPGARTFHCSPCTRAQPSLSKSSSASPDAPIICSR